VVLAVKAVLVEAFLGRDDGAPNIQRCKRCGVWRATWDDKDYIYGWKFAGEETGPAGQRREPWDTDWGFDEPNCREVMMRRALR
jgi:hypothetical protein